LELTAFFNGKGQQVCLILAKKQHHLELNNWEPAFNKTINKKYHLV